MRPFRFLPKVLRVLLISNAVVFGLAFIGGLLGLQLNLPGVGAGSIREYVAYFGAFWPFAPEQAWRSCSTCSCSGCSVAKLPT